MARNPPPQARAPNAPAPPARSGAPPPAEGSRWLGILLAAGVLVAGVLVHSPAGPAILGPRAHGGGMVGLLFFAMGGSLAALAGLLLRSGPAALAGAGVFAGGSFLLPMVAWWLEPFAIALLLACVVWWARQPKAPPAPPQPAWPAPWAAAPGRR